MAKVLISFLGVAADGYKPANYRFGNGTVISSTFIAKALKEYYHIDKLILIGTAHSMWDEIYKALGKDDTEYDLEECKHLKEKCTGSNHKTNLLKPKDIKMIEKRMGSDSRVVIIKYGLNDEEIAYNTRQIFHIESLLRKEDTEIYLDITHSFRSLPIYLMNCLIYLKDVSTKKFEIKSISYGMLDVSREFGEADKPATWMTPVVELKNLMAVQDWITGAYNFKEFGNTYKIASLLEQDTTGDFKSVAKEIRKFADIKNLNFQREYREAVDSLKPLTEKNNLPKIGQMVIAPAMTQFVERFPQKIPLSMYQFRMAKWHNEHHNHGYALMTLVESTVTYGCELCGVKNLEDRTKREIVKDALSENYRNNEIKKKRNRIEKEFMGKGQDFAHFAQKFKIVNEARNVIAHNSKNKNINTYQTIIKRLNDGITVFEKYIEQL